MNKESLSMALSYFYLSWSNKKKDTLNHLTSAYSKIKEASADLVMLKTSRYHGAYSLCDILPHVFFKSIFHVTEGDISLTAILPINKHLTELWTTWTFLHNVNNFGFYKSDCAVYLIPQKINKNENK